MSSPSLVSMAQQFSGLPMNSLIGGPLNAAANANGMMAVTQTDFLLNTCFSIKNESGIDSYEPIMIEMKLTRGVITPADPTSTDPSPAPSIEHVTTSFNLPLLTVMPLNSLAVETVEVGFEMEVKSSFSHESSTKAKSSMSEKASFKAKVDYGFYSATVKGSVSHDSSHSHSTSSHYKKSNSAKYTVKVTAGQLPLPHGVTTILDAFTKSIQPIKMPAVSTATTPPKSH